VVDVAPFTTTEATMARISLGRRKQDLKRRIAQSMRVSGFATARCRKLQKRLARIAQLERALRRA
jgi:hypothetical protein